MQTIHMPLTARTALYDYASTKNIRHAIVDEYIAECEEHEDLEVLCGTQPAARVADFAEYLVASVDELLK